jgi:hypothetical protein
MTPRERADALVGCHPIYRLDDVWTFTEAVALTETALDEHTRAPAAREACAHEWLEGRGLLCTMCGEMLFIETALAEHTRALLADDEATIEAMARAMVDAYCARAVDAHDYSYITPTDREAARAALAALRRKAFAQ